MKNKLTVVGITNSTIEEINNGWEYKYILEDLLYYYDIDLIITPKPTELYENCLIIYSCNSRNISNELFDYFKKYNENKIKFNLYHISNENLNHNCEYYDFANIVFRNYYDTNINKNNVHTLPLGYKSGFKNKNKEYKQMIDKKYDICFIGQLKSDRNNLYSIIKKFNNNFIHLTEKWDCKNSLKSSEVNEIYSETKIIPAPMGNISVDSFRICEILESGSIPIIKLYNGNDYFINIFGNHPIPVVSDWDELFLVFNQLKDNEEKLKEINEWYHNFKENLRIKIKNLLN
jgi:hypothetical protein